VRKVLSEVEVRVVQTLSAGVDWILPLIPEGVVLADGSGIHDAPVAEWVVMALLALLKDLPGFLKAQEEARWAPRRLADLEGKAVLLLGYGSIGRAVEARLRPFGVEVLPVAKHPRPGVYTREDLPHLLPRADAVVLLLPLTPETKGIVDRDFLLAMKEGALLLNAGRGGLVDAEALLEALKGGPHPGRFGRDRARAPARGPPPLAGPGPPPHPPRGWAFRGVSPPGGPLPFGAGKAVPAGGAPPQRGAGGVLMRGHPPRRPEAVWGTPRGGGQNPQGGPKEARHPPGGGLASRRGRPGGGPGRGGGGPPGGLPPHRRRVVYWGSCLKAGGAKGGEPPYAHPA
jgi:hypothetical protein